MSTILDHMSLEPSKRSFSAAAVLRVFWQELHQYRYGVYFIVLATITTVGIRTVILPYVGKLLFDGLATASRNTSAVQYLTNIILIFTAIELIRWVVNFFLQSQIVRIQTATMAKLEQRSFAYLIGHSYQFFQDHFSGSLVRRITRISRSFEDIFDNIQEKLIPVIVTLVGVLAVLLQRNLLIGSIVTVWVIIMLGYNYLYARWKISENVIRAAQDSRCTGFLSDAISNVLTIKLFTGVKREGKEYEKESNMLRDMRFAALTTHVKNYSFQSIIILILQAGILLTSIRYWSQGRLSAGDIVLFQAYFLSLNTSVLDFSRFMRMSYTSFTDASEMVEILDQPHGIQDKRGAKILKATKGGVQFDHVTFSYIDNQAILNDFDLTIRPGEKVALVGSSGAGKSTVIKTLFRFYNITEGSILIDGQDITTVTQDSLRGAISIVPQEPVLFHRSLLDNIRYGRTDASEKDIVRAAKLAHCDTFIKDLPEKYETFVGERGVKLSGGERQRVAIARAILKDAPILVLDEATSSLDSESEMLIQDALKSLMKGKTTIVIAHRLSTIMSMDRIVIMDEGKVVDIGTHEELVKRAGIYQKLWNIQVGGFLQEVA